MEAGTGGPRAAAERLCDLAGLKLLPGPQPKNLGIRFGEGHQRRCDLRACIQRLGDDGGRIGGSLPGRLPGQPFAEPDTSGPSTSNVSHAIGRHPVEPRKGRVGYDVPPPPRDGKDLGTHIVCVFFGRQAPSRIGQKSGCVALEYLTEPHVVPYGRGSVHTSIFPATRRSLPLRHRWQGESHSGAFALPRLGPDGAPVPLDDLPDHGQTYPRPS